MLEHCTHLDVKKTVYPKSRCCNCFLLLLIFVYVSTLDVAMGLVTFMCTHKAEKVDSIFPEIVSLRQGTAERTWRHTGRWRLLHLRVYWVLLAHFPINLNKNNKTYTLQQWTVLSGSCLWQSFNVFQSMDNSSRETF